MRRGNSGRRDRPSSAQRRFDRSRWIGRQSRRLRRRWRRRRRRAGRFWGGRRSLRSTRRRFWGACRRAHGGFGRRGRGRRGARCYVRDGRPSTRAGRSAGGEGDEIRPSVRSRSGVRNRSSLGRFGDGGRRLHKWADGRPWARDGLPCGRSARSDRRSRRVRAWSDPQVDRSRRSRCKESDSGGERRLARGEIEPCECGNSAPTCNGGDLSFRRRVDGFDHRQDDWNRSGLVPAPNLGGTPSAGHGVERLVVGRHEDLKAAVVRLPADGALGHGCSRIPNAADSGQPGTRSLRLV